MRCFLLICVSLRKGNCDMIEISGKKLCENCFEEMNRGFCEHCGYNPEAVERDLTTLPAGTVLVGKYIVGKVIGKGGFGVTYLAYDVVEGKKVAIKEFFPYGVVTRVTGTTTVSVASTDKTDIFKTGAEKFYNEAKLVSKFNGNPNIVSVYGFFYENGTAYFSMEYLKGHTLKNHIQRYGVLNSARALFIAQSVSNALMAAHSSSVLHRDVSPDNIIICDNGDVKLIDFGAARQVVAEQSQTFSVILKPGFAPLEQYQKKGNQGPWTDIYSLGATLYYILTKDIPDDPMSRMDDDEEYRSNKHGIHPELWNIISKSTELRIEDRYSDIFLLRNELSNVSFEAEPLVDPQNPEPMPELPATMPYNTIQPGIQPTYPQSAFYNLPTQYDPNNTADTAKSRKKRTAVIAAICSAAAAAVIAMAIILPILFSGSKEDISDAAADAYISSDSSSSEPEITEADEPDEEDNEPEDEPEDEPEEVRAPLIDDIPAASGHYTAKDLGKYIGRTSDEITNEFGFTMAWLYSQVNASYEYDDVTFWVIDDYGVTKIVIDADIVEYKGETLDKPYDELVNLLGTPFYDYTVYSDGQMYGSINYLMNGNLYVTISDFYGVNGAATSVTVTLYNDKLPFELDYLKEIFDSRNDFEDIFGYPTYAEFDSLTYSMVYTYNVFEIEVSSDSGSLSSLQVLADHVKADGKTLNKPLSKIKKLLGTPVDEGEYSDGNYNYYMHYILDAKINLFVFAENADGDAKSIVVTPCQTEEEETIGDVNANYTTRDSYMCTLALDSYGGFVLSVNRMIGFTNFSGTYYKTKDGYRFEVAVGRNELQEFEMKWQGDALVYYGENIGSVSNGNTAFYPVRTVEEIKYGGKSVVDAMIATGSDVLAGVYFPKELFVDGQRLDVTVDDLLSIFGAYERDDYDDYYKSYQKVYWLESETTHTTFEVKFYYKDSGKIDRIDIEELDVQ